MPLVVEFLLIQADSNYALFLVVSLLCSLDFVGLSLDPSCQSAGQLPV